MSYKIKNKGHTLVELLISCAILSLVLLAVVIIFKNSWSVFRWGDVESDQLQEVRIAMNNLYREIRLSEQIYNPKQHSFTEDEFRGDKGNNTLVFNSINGDSKRVIGYALKNYRLNENINRYVYDLYKLAYDPGYDQDIEDSIKVIEEPRKLSSFVTDFNVSRETVRSPMTIKLGVASRHKDKPSFQVICKIPIKIVIKGGE